MGYEIFTVMDKSPDVALLELKVKVLESMLNGYVIQGGVNVTTALGEGGPVWVYSQALVKYPTPASSPVLGMEDKDA